MWNYGWLVIVAAWVVWEAWALRSSVDEKHPFTFWVRKALGLRRGPFSLGWWATLAFVGWVAVHFLVEGVG